MKTDRKLLELAALAAGLVYEHPGIAYPAGFKEQVATWHPVTSGCDKFEHIPLAEWNPLTDDGDALRLAVKLGLVVDFSRPSAALPFARHSYDLSDGGNNAETARRAIVRAAAEIGIEQCRNHISATGATHD